MLNHALHKVKELITGCYEKYKIRHEYGTDYAAAVE